MAENQPENQEAVVPAAGVVQIPRELPFIYRWVANDVLVTPSSLDQQYLDELKLTGVLFGGGIWNGDTGWKAARRGERVCFMNLDHPTVPHWLWVNEVMFTEFGYGSLFRTSSSVFSTEPPWPRRNFIQIRGRQFVVSILIPRGRRRRDICPLGRGSIVALYEDSFHDFKGRYFKIFPVGDHRPFWLSLEGDGRFPPYWSDQAGFDIVPATYQRLNADQRDTAIILVHLFAQNNLNPKFLMNNSDEARKDVVEMAGNDVTLARLRRLIRPAPAKSLPSPLTVVPSGGARSVPAESLGKTQAEPEGGSSTNVGRENVGFVKSHLLGPKVQEVLRDCDPLESVRWAEWAMIRAATIMKSVEPRLSIAEELERRNARLLADAKTLSLQKMVLEEEKVDAVQAKLKVEEDLKVVKVEKFRGLAAEEKVRADLAEASAADLQKQCEDLAEDAKAAVAATEGALKAQLAVLLPDFDTDQISFFKDIMDGKVVDPTE
ncbi:hypothetical protein PIB30_103494 [Stylosanthes scabra]|uniref:Uncharacterized protein n=1 Tax=Stylosanthes scabra TaxID=79078 RepID=A0ABU6X0L8_9FABA|nr:hypothetical protein [Stylosanthes scabra]